MVCTAVAPSCTSSRCHALLAVGVSALVAYCRSYLLVNSTHAGCWQGMGLGPGMAWQAHTQPTTQHTLVLVAR